MHQSMWKSFRDALEMHWKSAEFNMQGHTLTLIGLKSLVYPCTVKSKCVLISYPLQLEDSVYNPLYNLPIGGFLSNYLSHLFWNPPFRRIIDMIHYRDDFHPPYRCQGMSETRNVLHPSTCGAPMYLWNGHSRG